VETRVASPERFRSWSRFALLLCAVALLCHAGALLAGPSVLRIALVVVAFLLGLWAYSAASVAGTYRDAGEEPVSTKKRTMAGCLLPVGVAAAMLCLLVLSAVLEYFIPGCFGAVGWFLAALLLVLTMGRLAVRPPRWSEYRP